jgi:hypothetical protein
MRKKIMFNDKFCLTQAVLDGTKTMTRRIENPTKMAAGHTMEDVETIFHEYSSLLNAHCFSLHDNEKQIGVLRPRYQVGEVVAIAQCYLDIGNPQFDKFGHDVPGNTNKMFVKVSLMPHHIKITDVRMEHLQAISDEDCLREGIFKKWHAPACRNYFYVQNVEVRTKDDVYLTPQEAYATLIDKISGKGTWERNPWMVVYEFEKAD